MQWLWPSSCAGCGRVGAGRLCPSCRTVGYGRLSLGIPGLPGTWALGPYEGPLGEALRAVKAHGDDALARELAALFARRLAHATASARFAAIVPAPSTPWTRFRRGFALAAVLARALGRASGIPVVHALSRRRGAKQSGLDRAGRLANLAGTVRCEEAPAGAILLVDDVLTTGATADACTRELLGAGATRVWLAVVAVVR